MLLDVPLLLIGDATDGPCEELVRIDSEAQLLRLFGGYFYAETTFASGASGHTLAEASWGDRVVPLRRDGDGELIPKTLFEFSTSGTALRFTAPGPATSGATIFQGRRIPTPGSLLHGYYAVRDLGVVLHVVRLGGEHASVTSGDYVWTARYAGSRYNGTEVDVTATTVTVAPPAGCGRTRTYTPATDLDLYEELALDRRRGWQPLSLSGPLSSTALTVPTGTYVLSGGEDGSCTAALVSGFLAEVGLAGVDVLCPLGLTTTEVSGAGILATLADAEYPTLLVAQAPVSGTALTGTINDHRHLVSVGFDVTLRSREPGEQTGPAAPLVAALVARDRFRLALAPVPRAPVAPRYTQDELHQAAASGHTVAYESLSVGPALYRVPTGDPQWPASTFRAYQEVVRAIQAPLFPLLGEVLLDFPMLRREVERSLAGVRSGRVWSWDLQLRGDTLYADVEFQPWGEVQVIRGSVALGDRRV